MEKMNKEDRTATVCVPIVQGRCYIKMLLIVRQDLRIG
jgi:hypothetical protein